MGRAPGYRQSPTDGLIEVVTPDGFDYWYDPNDPDFGYLVNNRFSTKYPMSYLWGTAAPTQNTGQQTVVGQQAREYTAAALDSVIGTLYGKDRIGGDVFFGPVETNNQTSTIVGLGFGDGPFDSLVKVEDSSGRVIYNGGGVAIAGPGIAFAGAAGALPDGSTYDFSSALFRWYPGVDAPATADSYLYGSTGEAAATFERYPGRSYAALAFSSDPSNQLDFTNLKWTIKGRKVYDPRKDSTNGGVGTHRLNDPTTWEWSENAMLCTADFVRCKYVGIGAGPNGIDWSSVARIANICDQLNTDGTKRFTLNLRVVREASAEATLRTLLSHFRASYAIVADPVTQKGKFKFYIDDTATDTASGLTGVVLDETNCRVVKRPAVLSSQTPTQVFWSWVDPSRDYQTVQADALTQDAQNGTVPIIPTTLNGEGTRYAGEAQSAAVYNVLKKNAGQGLSVAGVKAYPFLALEIYDVVTCNFPSFAMAGWQGRIIRKTRADNGECLLDLEPYNAAIYAAVTATVETKPTITIPNPYATPPAVTGLMLAKVPIGGAAPGERVEVDWTPPSSWPYYDHSRISVSEDGGATWYLLPNVASGPVYLPARSDTISYTVKIETISLQGRTSAPTTATIIVNDIPPERPGWISIGNDPTGKSVAWWDTPTRSATLYGAGAWSTSGTGTLTPSGGTTVNDGSMGDGATAAAFTTGASAADLKLHCGAATAIREFEIMVPAGTTPVLNGVAYSDDAGATWHALMSLAQYRFFRSDQNVSFPGSGTTPTWTADRWVVQIEPTVGAHADWKLTLGATQSFREVWPREYGADSTNFSGYHLTRLIGAGAYGGGDINSVPTQNNGLPVKDFTYTSYTYDQWGQVVSTTVTEELYVQTISITKDLSGFSYFTIGSVTASGATQVGRQDVVIGNGANHDIAIANQNTTLVRLTGATADGWTLDGLVGGYAGRPITVYNATGHSGTILKNVGSTAGNRFGFPIDFSMDVGESLDLIYDDADGLWRRADAWALAGVEQTSGVTAGVAYKRETLTFAGSATVDSVANLLPANALILGVAHRVETTLSGGGVTGYSIGDSRVSDRFVQNSTSIAAGNGDGNGLRQWDGQVTTSSAGPWQKTAAKVRLTAIGGTPTAGAVEIIIAYLQIGAPTS